MTNSSGKLRLNFRFEWGGPAWLRGADRAARDEVGAGPCQTRVGLSAETLARGNALSDWHNTALNWDYPPAPGPWRQEECDRFNAAVKAFFADLQRELGDTYELVNMQQAVYESPDLDAYLQDPARFNRRPE